MTTTMTSASLLLLIIFKLMIFISHPSLRRVGGEGDGRISAVDLAALVSIKDSLTDLPGSSFFSTWDSAAPDPCSSYDGVTCSEIGGAFRVTALSLGSGLFGSLGLAGSLPESLSQLGELTQLILNPGLVTGPVPPGLGRLVNLRVLSLAHNRLSGPIPASLLGLPGLHTLDLGFNRLSGPIPPGLLTGLPSLKVLILAGNRLTDELPPSPQPSAGGSGQPGGLLHLDLKSNLLVGPIWPSSLPLTLRYVSLSENKMWGPLNGLESLSELVYLDLSANQFSGALPVSLLRPSLSTLLLHHNNLSGQIATTAGGESVVIAYPEGSIVDLSYNALSGGLPEALAGAETLCLNNNHLTGPVPDGFAVGAVSGRTRTLYLQHNFLDAFPKSFSSGMLPGEVEVCLAYNCMVPPIGLETCPDSAGRELSRPAGQCSIFHNN